MKKLSKIQLKDVLVLEEQEMKRIYGGSGGGSGGLSGACFSCSCDNSGANPPYVSSWIRYYASADSMQSDINKMCRRGGGCDQISLSSCM